MWRMHGRPPRLKHSWSLLFLCVFRDISDCCSLSFHSLLLLLLLACLEISRLVVPNTTCQPNITPPPHPITSSAPSFFFFCMDVNSASNVYADRRGVTEAQQACLARPEQKNSVLNVWGTPSLKPVASGSLCFWKIWCTLATTAPVEIIWQCDDWFIKGSIKGSVTRLITPKTL